MKNGRYGLLVDGQLHVWHVERLWRLAEALPEETISLDLIHSFDEATWFSLGNEAPTCRNVARHAKRIFEADLRFPILLDEHGYVMDGMHRVAKAWIEGQTSIRAKVFSPNPPPDEILDAP